MAYIRLVSDREATGLLKTIFDQAAARAGRVWNIVRLQSPNPPICQASLAFYFSLMHRDNRLPRRLRETLAVVVSRANACHY